MVERPVSKETGLFLSQNLGVGFRRSCEIV